MLSRSKSLEILEGTVDRIVFENGVDFFILKALTPGGLVTLAGSGRVSKGQTFRAEGSWTDHPKFGRQFKVSAIETKLPATKDAMIAFLSGGLAVNVGKIFAKKLVDFFGTDLPNILSQDEKTALKNITRVPGIGKKRASEIVRVWHTELEFRNLIEFCSQAGVSPKDAGRIRRAGVRVSELEADPYQLLQLLERPNFQKIDLLARKAGVAPDSPERLRAATAYVLQKWAEEGGHTLMPLKNYRKALGEILTDFDDLAFSDNSLLLLSGASLQQRDDDPDPALVAYDGEPFIAKELADRQLSTSVFKTTPVRSGPYSAKFKDRVLTLTEVQSQAVDGALKNAIFILAGGPGTGKSSIAKTYLEELVRAGVQKDEVLLCAPTGRAARRLSETTGFPAMTIHKAVGYGLAEGLEPPISSVRVLVVDECSMLDVSLLGRLLSKTPQNTKILFVGDPYQLPSIGPGKVLGDMLASARIPSATLTEIHRQSGNSEIPVFAQSIKAGIVPKSSLPLQGVCRLEQENSRETAASIVSCVMDDVRAGKNILDVQVLTAMHKGTVGTTELNKAIQSAFISPAAKHAKLVAEHASFHVGDKIMQRKNDYAKGVMNGEIGIVSKISLATKELFVKFDGGIVPYDEDELGFLQLAYATTVHKAQGSEYDKVYVVVDESQFFLLNRSLLYTAATRSKQTLVLVGQTKALIIGVYNEKTILRETFLKNALQKEIPTKILTASENFGNFFSR